MPLTRPTHRAPQTLAQARADFKKYGPRISSQEQRRLDRGAELFRRAEKIRQDELRRKQAAERKRVKEEKDKEARKRMDIASQRPYLSQRQRLLTGFVKGSEKPQEERVREVEEELRGNDEGHKEGDCEDIWSDEGLDDGALLDALAPVDLQEHLPRSPFPSSNFAVTINNLWDDFLLSNTQVEREISVDLLIPRPPNTCGQDLKSASLSIQGLMFAVEEEEGGALADTSPEVLARKERDQLLMPPPLLPIVLRQGTIDVPQRAAARDDSATDFGLSTQDLGDFGA